MQTLNEKLMHAVYQGKYNTVRKLVKEGADPKNTKFNGKPIIELAFHINKKIYNFLSDNK